MDSGASATVVGPDQIKAVKATEPDPSRFYNMADGSIIPHKCQKHFRPSTDVGGLELTTNVADVDLPLLSVAQMLYNGSKVVLATDGCYVEYKNGRRDKLEQRDGLFVFKLWVPRNLGKPVTAHPESPFQGHA